MASHYDVLKVASASSAADLRSAYLQRVLETHPDKRGSEEAFRAVVLAFQVLSNPASRAIYDRQLGGGLDSGSAESVKRRRRGDSGCSQQGDGAQSSQGEQEGARRAYLQQAIELLQSMSPSSRRSAILSEFIEKERVRMEVVLSSLRRSADSASHSEAQPQVADLGGRRKEGCHEDGSVCTSSSDEEESCEPHPKSKRLQRNIMIANGENLVGSDQNLLGNACRGICRTTFRGKQGAETVYYNAEACLSCTKGVYFFVSARKRRELALCVQDHIALTRVVEQAHANSRDAAWEVRISEAFDVMMREHDLTLGSGKRPRGASTDVDVTCLFLRYRIHVNWDYRYGTNMLSPQYFDLREALWAFQRIRLARGTEAVSRKTNYAQLQQILSRVRNELVRLYLEDGAKSDTDPIASGHARDELETLGEEGACSTSADVEQQLLQREAIYLATRDAVLLRRLQRTLRSERAKEEARRRRDEVLRKAEAKRLENQRRRALLHWDPRESFDEMQHRIARLSHQAGDV